MSEQKLSLKVCFVFVFFFGVINGKSRSMCDIGKVWEMIFCLNVYITCTTIYITK